MRRCCTWLILVSSATAFARGEDDEPPSALAASHPDAEQSAKLIKVPPGLRAEVWAKEPLLRNPVAFAFDERGRAFVAETSRFGHGVLSSAGDRKGWLGKTFRKEASAERLARINDELGDRDLASRTVEDRAAMVAEFMDAGYMTERSERLRLVEDTDGDGHADRGRVFAAGFDSAVDGIAAGVLARKGDVYLANIPNLWLLRDRDGDGVADLRRPLHRGFGVRYQYTGHDLHGPRIGPDGRLYFSVGDRGAHVEAEGRTFDVPFMGAVFRCELDGSGLELFATGLRNPQDSVFDAQGNLFTGDNNGDGGDKARWVFVVEGGDSGWRNGFQYLPSRGPWNEEKLWHKARADHPAYLVPPIEHIASGPSGAAYYPGTGLSAEYAGRFFLVDFRAEPTGSGIHGFRLEPQGAGFQLRDAERLIWNVVATDVKFGVDGGLYVLDWVEGWALPGKGRIFRIYDPALTGDAAVQSVRRLLAGGLERLADQEIVRLLAHADMRIRQEAQLELTRRGAVDVLLDAATGSREPMARLHGIWGAGHWLRTKSRAAAGPTLRLAGLLADPDSEVRAQAARMLGDTPAAAAVPGLRALVADGGQPARVRFFAATALGKTRHPDAIPALLALLQEHGAGDPFLRQAAIVGLAATGNVEALLAAAGEAPARARQGVVVALRRLGRAEVGRFLADPDPEVVREAAIAVGDEPLESAMAALAAVTPGSRSDAATLHRIVNANFRLGSEETAGRLAALATRGELPSNVRADAVAALGEWGAPSSRDRVTGVWHPLPAARDPAPAASAFQPVLASLLRSPSEAVQLEAVRATQKLGIATGGPLLTRIAASRAAPGPVRVEALRAAAALGSPGLAAVLKAVIRDPLAELRAAALRLWLERDPVGARPLLDAAVARGTVVEKQTAIVALGQMSGGEAEARLGRWLDALNAERLPASVELDVLEAAAARKTPGLQQKLALFERRRPKGLLGTFRESIAGGNEAAGKAVFNDVQLACRRCHAFGGQGGDVGPDLKGIGRNRSRQQILEAIVLPNKDLAVGFESIVLTMNDGDVKGGIVKRETGGEIEIASLDAGRQVINKAEVKGRQRGASAMPEGFGDILSKRKLRDLIEFLAASK